jgi:hypothetical protein
VIFFASLRPVPTVSGDRNDQPGKEWMLFNESKSMVCHLSCFLSRIYFIYVKFRHKLWYYKRRYRHRHMWYYSINTNRTLLKNLAVTATYYEMGNRCL